MTTLQTIRDLALRLDARGLATAAGELLASAGVEEGTVRVFLDAVPVEDRETLVRIFRLLTRTESVEEG